MSYAALCGGYHFRCRGAAAIRYGVANLFGSEKDRRVDKDYLILKRSSASRPSGEWNEDDYDVLAEGEVVGRIFKANTAPVWFGSCACPLVSTIGVAIFARNARPL
jgi:hypothetical protein